MLHTYISIYIFMALIVAENTDCNLPMAKTNITILLYYIILFIINDSNKGRVFNLYNGIVVMYKTFCFKFKLYCTVLKWERCLTSSAVILHGN